MTFLSKRKWACPACIYGLCRHVWYTTENFVISARIYWLVSHRQSKQWKLHCRHSNICTKCYCSTIKACKCITISSAVWRIAQWVTSIMRNADLLIVQQVKWWYPCGKSS